MCLPGAPQCPRLIYELFIGLEKVVTRREMFARLDEEIQKLDSHLTFVSGAVCRGGYALSNNMHVGTL